MEREAGGEIRAIRAILLEKEVMAEAHHSGNIKMVVFEICLLSKAHILHFWIGSRK